MTNKNKVDYFKNVKKIMILILFLNLLVAIIKILYGFSSNILSISTDGYHSLADAISNIIGIIGITIAARPNDNSHRYGYYKIETLASIGIAMLLFIVGFEVITATIGRFYGTAIPLVSTESFVVMVVTLIINIAVSVYEGKKGKELKSDLLISDSKHTKSDVFSSLAIIFGLILIQAGLTILDPIISLIIALIIFKEAIEILYHNLNILMDKNIMSSEEIHDVVDNIEGVSSVHAIRTRGTPSNILVDMHIVVDSNLTILEAHNISHNCENALYKKYDNIYDVVIHNEPEQCLNYENIIFN